MSLGRGRGLPQMGRLTKRSVDAESLTIDGSDETICVDKVGRELIQISDRLC
jgi:hypothetical protein